ncbi:putative membrane protein, partial [Helicobacter pylori NQ4044]
MFFSLAFLFDFIIDYILVLYFSVVFSFLLFL